MTAILPMILVCGAVAVLPVAIHSQGASSNGAPAPRLSLAVSGNGEGARLVLRDGPRDVASIAAPPAATRAALEAAIATALWHPNGRDVALAVTGGRASFVAVLLEQPRGAFTVVDVSEIERRNIGGIGPNRTYPVRRTRPVEWLADRQLEGSYAGRAAVQIRFRTEVRDAGGTRYRAADVLLITRDGTPLWR